MLSSLLAKLGIVTLLAIQLSGCIVVPGHWHGHHREGHGHGHHEGHHRGGWDHGDRD